MLKIIILAAALAASNLAMADMPTRYGKLSVGEGQELLLNGKPLSPAVEGNTRLDLLSVHQFDDTDAVILRNYGGTACPIQIMVLTMTPRGAKASPEFGSCSDYVTYSSDAESLTISMPKMQGKGTEVYKYSKGVVKQGGKAVQ